jgi:hypothetical protein
MISLEELLTNVFAKERLIGADDRRGGAEEIGIGRFVVSDEDWRTRIAGLMQAAMAIIILPSSNPGTLWELQQIAGNTSS